MKLQEILDKNPIISQNTDKHTIHDYIKGFYESNFTPYQTTAKRILEIGVQTAGSIALWREYFQNATITGLDIMDRVSPELRNLDRVNYIFSDAYTQQIVNSLPEFDICIDDGPHSLGSMIFFVSQYSKKLTKGGMLVVEDVQDYSWFSELSKYVPENWKSEIVDIRNSKNRYDDLMFIVRRVD